MTEIATCFDCQGETLVGILTVPLQAPRRAVLIAVGGAQYRTGSHRQFTLMARALGQSGLAVMRFDFRGMGDSSGEGRLLAESGVDIAAALNHLQQRIASVKECVVLGLCDGASAAVLSANGDPRIRALILINPWTGDADAAAATRLQHYYLHRLTQAEFWRKLLAGRWPIRSAVTGLLGDLRQAIVFRRGGKRSASGLAPASNVNSNSILDPGVSTTTAVTASALVDTLPLRDQMCREMARFTGPILLLLSSRDLTALQFKAVLGSSAPWRALARRKNLTMLQLAGANHTFSTDLWRSEVLDMIVRWNQTW